MSINKNEKEFHELITVFYPETILKGKKCSYILNIGIMIQFESIDKKIMHH